MYNINEMPKNKKEIPNSYAINADTISQAWMQALEIWDEYGVKSLLDNGDMTKRINLVININNLNVDQVHPFCPITPRMMIDYRKEITEEYADYQLSLKNNDDKKFVYNYAGEIFRQTKKFEIKNYSLWEILKAWNRPQEYHNNMKENLLNLRENARRHVGVLWQNEIHIPMFEDQPCWIAYKFELLNENELILYGVFRSWDLYRGMPANLPAIVYGVKKLIKELGLPYKLVKLIFYGMDVHIYKNAWDEVHDILNKKNTVRCPKCGNLLPKNTLLIHNNEKMCIGCRFK